MRRYTNNPLTRFRVLCLTGIVAALVAEGSTATELRTVDDRLVDIARTAPQFGGLYFDEESETLFINVVEGADGNETALVTDMVLSEFTMNERVTDRTSTTSVQYSILELDDWHRRVFHDIGIEGVVYTDMNEAKNRVEIGISTEAEIDDSLVDVRLGELGVPREAVIITRSEPIVKALHHHHRPVVGGLQIHNNAPIVSTCTLGFANWHHEENAIGLVTNSHCTDVESQVDGADFYQPGFVTFDLIGIEQRDPPPFTHAEDPACPVGRQCRYSDAAWLVNVEPPAPNWGFIASVPLSFNPFMDNWDGASKYRITRQGDMPITGLELRKVGRTTGYTRGTIINTCANVMGVPDLLCQTKLEGVDVPFILGGDSGSPVFRYPVPFHPDPPIQLNDVQLVGLLWGHSGPAIGFYSPISGVEADLGEMQACAPGPPSCPDPL